MLFRSGSVSSPFELTPHDAKDTRQYMRKSDVDKRIQPKRVSERSSITTHFNLVADDAVDNRTLMKLPDIERRSQAKEAPYRGSITFPYMLVAHDAIDTRTLMRWPSITRYKNDFSRRSNRLLVHKINSSNKTKTQVETLHSNGQIVGTTGVFSIEAKGTP